MKAKDLLAKLQKVDPELDVFFSHPDTNIIWQASGASVSEVFCEKEYGASEFDVHDFPVGYKFFNIH